MGRDAHADYERLGLLPDRGEGGAVAHSAQRTQEDAEFEQMMAWAHAKRPLGITLLSALHVLSGAGVVALGAVIVLVSLLGVAGPVGLALGGLVALAGVLIGRAGVQAWRLQPSGWAFFVCAYTITTLSMLIALAGSFYHGTAYAPAGSSGGPEWLRYSMRAGGAALMLGYLVTPKVMRAFVPGWWLAWQALRPYRWWAGVMVAGKAAMVFL
jgi:hypothetical protein